MSYLGTPHAPPMHQRAHDLAAGALGGLDLSEAIEECLAVVSERLPEMMTLRYMLRAARDAAYKLQDRVEEAEATRSRTELIDFLHGERDHRGYYLTCDQCCEDADLFAQLAS